MRPHDRLAMPPGSDAARLTRQLAEAHDDFLATGRLPRGVRPVVAASWRRSLHLGLDPETAVAPIRLDDAQLAAVRLTHPLAKTMPVIRRLLVDAAAEAGLLVAVSDAVGRLLWVEGSSPLRTRAEGMHFLAGADWSEASAGTNAPGTALETGDPVQFFGAEHLLRQVTPWSCSAAPIREPETGAVLGVLDITGGPEAATVQTLALVRATVAAAEAELRIDRLRAAPPSSALAVGFAPPRLTVLGRRAALLQHGATRSTLSLRHSEILLLLAEHPDGLSAGELAGALSAADHPEVTVRAEMSRLRAVLGSLDLGSRPYRLRTRLASDVAPVRASLAAGRLRAAVAAYPGPVLPASDAPGVVELRDALHDQLRRRLLAGRDPDALLAFADTPYGREDYPVWRAAHDALPHASPRAAEVRDRLHRLDRLLG